MRTFRKKNRGQSMIEFALLVPIAAGFLYWITAGFHASHEAGESSIKKHAKDLAAFDHGNGAFAFDGGPDLSPGRLTALVPSGDGLDPVAALAQIAVTQLSNYGLSQLLNRISFLDGSTWLSGAARGATFAAGTTFIGSGFQQVGWDAVKWGSAAGALSSGDATKFFQGDGWGGNNAREFFGSGLQQGAVGFASGGGDYKTAIAGAAGGMLNSDTSKGWFGNGENEILKGAARGAMEAGVTGAVNGKLDMKQMAIAAGMGAFRTKTVASMIPFSGSNPLQSASFGATNAAVAALVGGGKPIDALYAASSGALFSGQSMNALVGDSEWLAGGIGAAYGASVAAIKGEDAAAVALGAAQSMGTVMLSRELYHQIDGIFGDAKDTQNINQNLDQDDGEKAAETIKMRIDHSGESMAQDISSAVDAVGGMRT